MAHITTIIASYSFNFSRWPLLAMAGYACAI